MATFTAETRRRLAKLIRMLDASAGESAAAVSRIKSLLATEKLSFTDLGDLIEKGGTIVQSGPAPQQQPRGAHNGPFDENVAEFWRQHAARSTSAQTEEIRRQAEKWRAERRRQDERERVKQDEERRKAEWTFFTDSQVRTAAQTILETQGEFLQGWETDYLKSVVGRESMMRAMREKVGEIAKKVGERRKAA